MVKHRVIYIWTGLGWGLEGLGHQALHENECFCVSSGLYYKTIMIVIMTIVSDATISSITYDRH